MIVDSSAIVAIALDEADADQLYAVMRSAESAQISAANYLESGIVLDAFRDPVISGRLDEIMHALDVEVAAVTATHARTARQAYRDFGKGSGHPAQLNFGDCFAYALTVEAGEPLLYKGDDFRHTGVRSALDH